MKNLKCDLHLHTTASDGTWLPLEVVEQALIAGLGMIAVTDHETTANVLETEKIALAAGLKFLRGAEISATQGKSCFHILGYGIDIEHKGLQELLQHNERLLELKDLESIEVLAARGWAVEVSEYLTYENDRKRGGWKALNYLIDKGLCYDVTDFFTRVFTKENTLGFPVFPKVNEIIAMIHAAGGRAILAHPASEVHGPGLEKTMARVAGEAFDGFECFHSRHNVEDSAFLYEHCLANNLMITGGSDCHGTFVKNREIGKPEIYLEKLTLKNLI